MQRSLRIRPARTLAVLASTALLVTGLTVSPAAADHDRHGSRLEHVDRYYDGGPPGHGTRHAKHGKHDWKHHGHARHHEGFGRASYRGHEARHASYYCRPCNHRYASSLAFHRHLIGHHHVRPLDLPRALLQVSFGWVFHG